MSLQRRQSLSMQQGPAAENAASATTSASGAMAAGGSEPPLFRLDILRALQMHRRLALGFAAAGLALAAAYVAMSWPVYIAESQVYVQPAAGKIMDQGNNQQRWPYDSNSYDSFIQQQVQSASNPGVLINAMNKMPAGSWQREGESSQAAADRLGRTLKVERLGSSYQVSIVAQAKDPEQAAQIANAVANSMVEKAAHEENAGDSQRVSILQAERDRVQNQLNADLAEQDALNKQLGMAAVGTAAPDLIDNAIGATRDELIKARTEHDQAEARYAAIAGKSASPAALNAEADELAASDPGLASMKTSLNQRRATLVTQMANLTPNNPAYKLYSEELAQIDSSLDSMMQGLRAKAAARVEQKLRTDLERTAGVEAQLNGQLRQLAATAASATPKLQRASDLVIDIARLRDRYAAVDEALHNIMLQDSVPGAVHLSVAAIPPPHPALGKILRKVLPLALGGLLLGLLAALVANNLDPRIYIGADVKHLLGFAPMAQLPDFSEVSEEVAGEHLLRLAAGIEHACKDGGLESCVFTGTGPGAGVSTVATRVKEMLGTLGRTAALVDATESASIGTGSEQASAQAAVHSTALLLRAAEGTGGKPADLVLADTAPLTVSAETEYLARMADCTIVVIESGVTTRAQLRATANRLQRLNTTAAGFVLNRVELAKADPAFRQSVREMEMHLRAQNQQAARQSARIRNVAAEPARASAKLEVPKAAVSQVVPAAPIAQTAQPVAPAPQPVWIAAQERPAFTAPPAPVPHPAPAPAAAATVPEPAPQPAEAIPWWLTEAPPHSNTALAPQPKPRIGSWRPAYAGAGGRTPGAEEVQPVASAEAASAPSPLSGLRSAFFSLRLKELNKTRDPEPKNEEAASQDGELPASEAQAPAQSVAPTPQVEAAHPAAAQTFAPIPEPEPELVPAMAAESAASIPASRWVTAEPEILPPKPLAATLGDSHEEFQTLPSQRGQYRRDRR